MVRTRHLERFDERRQRDRLARAGIAEDRRRLRPHIADKAVLHTDQRRRDQDENHIDERRKDQINELSPCPRAALHAHQIIRYASAEERDVRKEQHQEQRDQQHGVRVSKSPDERFKRLHGGAHVVGEARRLVGKQKAQDERERERQHDADVLAPHAEVIAHDRPHLRQRIQEGVFPMRLLRLCALDAFQKKLLRKVLRAVVVLLPLVVTKLRLHGHVKDELQDEHQHEKRQRRAFARKRPRALHGEIVLWVQHERRAEIALLQDDQNVVEDERRSVRKVYVLGQRRAKQPHACPHGAGQEEEETAQDDVGDLRFDRPFAVDLDRGEH